MKVLWVCRRSMTMEEFESLEDIFGDVELVNFNKKVSNWKEIVKAGKECDVFIVSVPAAILKDLINPLYNDKLVLTPNMKRVPTGEMIFNPDTGREEDEFCYKHGGWDKPIEVKIEVVVEKFMS